MTKTLSPSKSSKPSLPALDRGLAILDLLIRAGGGPLRFGELRAHLVRATGHELDADFPDASSLGIARTTVVSFDV